MQKLAPPDQVSQQWQPSQFQPQQFVQAFQSQAQPVVVVQLKSRGVFVALALFFGALGIHNFYAGYTGRGAAQLLITIIGSCIVVGPVISIFWALIEIFAVSTDARGERMV